MEKIFLSLYLFFKKHKAACYISMVLCFLATGYFAAKIQLVEDIAAVLPKDEKTEKLNTVFQNSKFFDKLVIHVNAKDKNQTAPDSLVAFTQAYVEAASNDLAPYIKKIDDKVNDELVLDMFHHIQEELPIYLNEADYKTIDSLTTPDQLQQTLAHNIQTLSSPAGLALKKMISNDPVGISFIGLKKLQQLQYDENFDLYDGYIITKDKKDLLFFISPAYPPNNTGKNLEFLKGLDAIADSLQQVYPGIEAGYYGSTAVSAGNALQIRKDNLLTQGIAVLFIMAFIAWYFRKKSAPFVMLLPVAFGALFSLAIIYFLKGRLSVIALGTGSIVLGIAINYALHIFNHYRHTNDMRQVLKDLASPMTIGGFTTIAGFLVLQFVQSDLLKDIGLFAAFALIGASLFSLIYLPHLITPNATVQTHTHSHNSVLDRIAHYKPEKKAWVIISIALLTIVFGYTSRYASFETDMMHMNYLSPRLKKAEQEMNRINAYALQTVYLLSSGKTLDDALTKNESALRVLDSLQNLNLIQKYSGISPTVVSSSLQKEKIDRWNSYWTEEKKQAVVNILLQEGKQLGYRPAAFDNFKTLLYNNYQVSETDSTNPILNNLLGDYVIKRTGETLLVTLIKTNQYNKPIVFKTLEGIEGTTVVDKQYLTNKLVENVNADFSSIAIMSSVLVFLVLLITYGRIELALATFIPMLITWVWILGIMGLFGIRFNIINIIISTLIFGLGDDYSIFIMDGLLQEYKTGKKLLASYKSSILLSAVTTIVGLGVLIFAKHPALKSIALISIIGMFCVVMMSQILIPFFFNFLIRNRVEKNKFPWTAAGLFKSIFAFSYFLGGCVLLNIAGFFLIIINPFNKTKGKLIYHAILSKFTWSLIYIMFNVKKEIINPLNEQFDKPAVVICNHQSFLDILLTTMLSPKLILLTNHWVYHSPFFGNVVRMAGYYPVKEGAVQSIEKLKESVDEGYSIVVFPEGTRSKDDQIKRFHKGAFYIAEELNIDILPLVIHGSGYSMSKSDFLLKDGRITLQFLPRIQPYHNEWGDNYSIRARKIGAYFRDAFQAVKADLETPDYFRETLHYNYIYKGPVLEWYMRIKVSLEKNYKPFEAIIPKQGKILDIGCGYGFLSYMLSFTSSERYITGIDYDEEKIATADHCFSKNDRMEFYHADALSFEFEQYDCIILSDVLHYLQPAEQDRLIAKCISHLNTNGVIIIRDGNAELRQRHRGTKLSEFFSTRMIGFNKTAANGLSFLQASRIHHLAERYHFDCTEIDQTKLTSNIIFVLKDKPTVVNFEARH